MESNKNQIECRLCGSNASKEFQVKVLNQYEVTYYKCEECDLLQSEVPFWLEEAYNKAISILDTGIFLRNNENVKKLTLLLTEVQSQLQEQNHPFRNRLFQKKSKPYQGKILDYGGGHGILVRLMRDVGFDCYWYDKYAKNDFSEGFSFEPKENYDVVLAFELFEHFDKPREDILEILRFQKPALLIFSTLLYGEKTPDMNWWYYSFEAGQHISFYNAKTLSKMEEITGYSVCSLAADFHVLIRKDLKLDLQRLRRSIRNAEKRFPSVKKLYQSKTFEDHILLKSKMN
ncbi:class I SAM-dependent methyltransferase [Leptospira sp. 201903071]|uniref:class I SAM-dependent methyltransferase n=1 Tax=Leptospira ainazelensis TaxID=2810034 RepID=UPI001965CCD2|nr:class I SAM-dependent methyltransferase [Leptospira ainazelensis]MBM9501985.1 class I SAM-dependent methyltransferase [Leptospira ainazelensis]